MSTLSAQLVRFCVAVMVGIVAGVVAALPQSQGMFLVGIQSIGLGLGLGVLLIGCFTMFTLDQPRWPAAGIASLAAVLTEHYWLYLTAMRNREDEIARQPAAGLFRPGWAEQSFLEFMQDSATAGTVFMWTLDASLIVLAAVVIVEFVGRRAIIDDNNEAPSQSSS